MEHSYRRTPGSPERRRCQHSAQVADITNDLREGHQGSIIEHPMVNVNASYAIVNRGKCPLKRERASTLTTPIA